MTIRSYVAAWADPHAPLPDVTVTLWRDAAVDAGGGLPACGAAPGVVEAQSHEIPTWRAVDGRAKRWRGAETCIPVVLRRQSSPAAMGLMAFRNCGAARRDIAQIIDRTGIRDTHRVAATIAGIRLMGGGM
jgi:hypothetical protein